MSTTAIGTTADDVHGVTATQIMNELRGGQQSVGRNDLHAVNPAECRREQAEFSHEQRLQGIGVSAVVENPGSPLYLVIDHHEVSNVKHMGREDEDELEKG